MIVLHQSFSVGNGGINRRPYRFQPDGKHICLRFGQPGHVARFCCDNMGASRSVSTQEGVAGESQQTGVVSYTSQQQGN